MIRLSLHLGFSATTRWWLWKAWVLVSISKRQPPPSMCVFSFCLFSSCFLTQLLLLLLSKTGKNKIVSSEQSALAIKTFKNFNLLGRTKQYVTFRHFPLLLQCSTVLFPELEELASPLPLQCNFSAWASRTTWFIPSPPEWGGGEQQGGGGGRRRPF